MHCRYATVAVLALVLAGRSQAAPPLEEERLHPGEVVFQDGKPHAEIDGRLRPVHSRREGGELVYYRLVRYDAEHGYVGEQGEALAPGVPATAAGPVTPRRLDGSGRPDFYNSPYNRDAPQRYFGPGFQGACSRYDGCRGVYWGPLAPVVQRD